jgi:hypothetical protein
MRRAVLSWHVVALALLGGAGALVLSVMVSWTLETSSGFAFDGVDLEAQRRYYLMSTLPHLISGACASAVVGALVGLPLVIGARYAGVVRSRRDAD